MSWSSRPARARRPRRRAVRSRGTRVMARLLVSAPSQDARAPSRGPTPTSLCRATRTTPRAAGPVRFGIGRGLAGESGTGQTVPTVAEAVQRDVAWRAAAGRSVLRGPPQPHSSHGRRRGGLRAVPGRWRGTSRAWGWTSSGGQVRYHPAPCDDGNIARVAYCAGSVRAFGPDSAWARPPGLQITNEVNHCGPPRSRPTAPYRSAVQALVEASVAAKRDSRGWATTTQADPLQLRVALRTSRPSERHAVWQALGSRGGRRLLRTPTGVGVGH
jgi:hypothetical protein